MCIFRPVVGEQSTYANYKTQSERVYDIPKSSFFNKISSVSSAEGAGASIHEFLSEWNNFWNPNGMHFYSGLQ